VAASLSVAKASADIAVPQLDLCAYAPAHWTVSVAFPHFDASSLDASYADSGCGRVILDVFASSGTGSLTLHGRASEMPGNKPACTGLTSYLSVYRRGVFDTSFQRIRTATFKGTWQPTAGGNPNLPPWSCSLTQTSGDPAASLSWPSFDVSLLPGIVGAATYRVAASARTTVLWPTTALPVSLGMACEQPFCNPGG